MDKLEALARKTMLAVERQYYNEPGVETVRAALDEAVAEEHRRLLDCDQFAQRLQAQRHADHRLLEDIRPVMEALAYAVVTHDRVYGPLLSRIDIALGVVGLDAPGEGQGG